MTQCTNVGVQRYMPPEFRVAEVGARSEGERRRTDPNYGAFRMDPEDYESALAMVKDRVRADRNDQEIIEEIQDYFPGTPWGFANGMVTKTRRHVKPLQKKEKIDDATFRHLKDRINQAIRENRKISRGELISEILDYFHGDNLPVGLVSALVDNALNRNEAYGEAFEMFNIGLSYDEVLATISEMYPRIPEPTVEKIVTGARNFEWKRRQEAREARENIRLVTTPSVAKLGEKNSSTKRFGKTARDRLKKQRKEAEELKKAREAEEARKQVAASRRQEDGKKNEKKVSKNKK